MRKAATLFGSDQVTDQWILDGMMRGDRFALEQLYETCFPTVERMVVMNTGTEDEAKDVFQEAVLVLYDKLTQQVGFELNCMLRTYLYAVSRRLWLKSLRDKNRFVPNGDVENVEPSEGDLSTMVETDLSVHLDKEAQFEKMEECLVELGEPCRQILLDFYMKGKSMQDICDSMGYTNADNVKNQKYKCLQRLKRLYFKR